MSSQTNRGADIVAELRFRVTLPGREVGRFMEVTGISFEYETTQFKEGGNNGYVHTLLGHMKYPNVVLKRGITQELALAEWALKGVTKAEPVQMTIDLMDPGSGDPVRSWTFAHAVPVKWTGPNLNTSSNQIATETLEVAHHGFAP